METVLITGASRGIGLELVRRYVDFGCKVIATHRGAASEELEALTAAGDVNLVSLEVTQQEDIDALAASLLGQTIDIIINNAGVIGDRVTTLDQVDADVWAQTLAVNTMAPMMIIQALLENLVGAANPRLISISSQLGSLEQCGTGMYAYRTSKAALNMAMKILANEQREAGITVCPIHPGWVATDMGGAEADIPPAESAAGIFDLIRHLTIADTGTFFCWDGSVHDW